MIEVHNITKTYGATVAVNKVSFQAKGGEIVGFLGPNGAGKSTTIKILTCYIVADEGRVSVCGHDVLEDALEVRRCVGYLPESTALYPEMRVLDFLNFMVRARQIPRAQRKASLDRVISLTGIERMLKKNIGHLSKGYRQRVGIAQALIHDPPVLIFDEPTSGLDPHQIIEIRRLIQDLGKEKLVLFSSHILQEISAICTRLLLIRDGELVADGSPDELRSMSGDARRFRVRVDGPTEEVQARLGQLEGVKQASEAEALGGAPEYEVICDPSTDVGPACFEAARDAGWVISRLEENERTLEDVYLELTARAS